MFEKQYKIKLFDSVYDDNVDNDDNVDDDDSESLSSTGFCSIDFLIFLLDESLEKLFCLFILALEYICFNFIQY